MTVFILAKTRSCTSEKKHMAKQVTKICLAGDLTVCLTKKNRIDEQELVGFVFLQTVFTSARNPAKVFLYLAYSCQSNIYTEHVHITRTHVDSSRKSIEIFSRLYAVKVHQGKIQAVLIIYSGDIIVQTWLQLTVITIHLNITGAQQLSN